MFKDFAAHADTAPKRLPGLVKVFLLPAYSIVLYAIAIRLFLPLAFGEVGLESIFWLLALIALFVASSAAITGIHTRARWAPECCAGLCALAIALHVAFAVRILYGVGIDGSSGLDYVLSITILGVLALITSLPAYYAFFRYFRHSSQVYAVFKPDEEPVQELPCLSVALLRILCAVVLICFTGMALAMLPMGDSADEVFKNYINLAICFFPQAMLSVLLLLQTYKKQLPRRAISVTLIFFICLTFIWPQVSSVLVYYFVDTTNHFLMPGRIIYSAVAWTSFVLCSALTLILWRIAGSRAENEYYYESGSKAKGIYIEFSPELILATFFVLHLLLFLIFLFRSLQGLPLEFSEQAFLILVSLVSIVLGGGAIFAALGKKQYSLSLNIIFMLSFLFLLGTFFVSAVLNTPDKTYQHIFTAFLRNFSLFGLSSGAFFWLLHERKRRKKFLEQGADSFAVSSYRKAPCIIMAGLVLYYSLDALCFNLMLPVRVMFDSSDTVFESWSTVFAVLQIDFVLAYIVCPAFIIRMLLCGVKQAKVFYALCAIWLSLFFIAAFTSKAVLAGADYLFSAFINHTYHLLTWQVLLLSVIFFCEYSANRNTSGASQGKMVQ